MNWRSRGHALNLRCRLALLLRRVKRPQMRTAVPESRARPAGECNMRQKQTSDNQRHRCNARRAKWECDGCAWGGHGVVIGAFLGEEQRKCALGVQVCLKRFPCLNPDAVSIAPLLSGTRLLLLGGIAWLSLFAPASATQLSQEDVEQVIAQAATKADRLGYKAIISVTDREGFVLAIWDVDGRVPTPLPPFSFDRPVLKLYSLVAGAITRASTAAFLSSNQNAFTSRTAGFIIQQHFPPGVRNAAPGPLVGVGFSSLFYSDVNRAKLIPPGFDGAAPIASNRSPGARAPFFPLTSLNDSPGGVPLYKSGKLVGGVGVTGDGSPTDLTPAGAIFFEETQNKATTGFKTTDDRDELVALAGQTHFRPDDEILASNVLINGIRIPYVHPRAEDIEDLRNPEDFGAIGRPIDVPLGAALQIPPDPTLAGFASGSPQASPAGYPYENEDLGNIEGEIRFPLRDDPVAAIAGREKIGKADRLRRDEVKGILAAAAARARITRAGIRLPIGTSAKVFIAVVNNPNKAGEKPQILGVYRTGEATIFSWDVAVQKARTALFFSNRQLAMSSRTVGFLAQRFYPPGLDGRPFGPLFGFQEAVSLRGRPPKDMKPGELLPFPGNLNLPNGMTIFPGGFPLYRDGYVVGAIGISGDGVDQDDLIGASGTVDFLADRNVRADQFTYRGARLPYAKFPRDPER